MLTPTPTVPRAVTQVIWNASAQTIDAERDAATIIPAVLARGGDEAVRWLFGRYGLARITAWVARDADGVRALPASERRFWLHVLLPDHPDVEPASLMGRWRQTRQPH